MKLTLLEKVAICLFVATMLVVIACTFIGTYQEMKTFNRFSKTKATFADAFFADLRVIPD